MTSISLREVTLRFPIYGTKSHSLKNSLLHFATGGRLLSDMKVIEVEALKSVTVNLKSGDRVALIGHNGAGKTTLLKLLAGVFSPTNGNIETRGIVHSLFDLMVGMDFDCSAYENIKVRGLLEGLSTSEIERLTLDVTEFAELGEFMHLPIRSYSAGMLLRFGFAIVTGIRSDILLIDEVIGVGDSSFQKKSRDRLLKRVDASEILVVSSHDVSTLKGLCNKAIWLDKGEVRSFGLIDEVLSKYEESLNLSVKKTCLNLQ